jgi:hypothetical protein
MVNGTPIRRRRRRRDTVDDLPGTLLAAAER